MPYTHAQTSEDARRYIVEPYVVAGDVYGTPPHTGRGGWTWYTGAAGWLAQFGLRLLGYERKGNFASLRALLPPQWQEVRLKVRVGASAYTLISRRGAPERSAVELIDDGQEHTEVFPARGAGKALQMGLRKNDKRYFTARNWIALFRGGCPTAPISSA